MPARRWLVASVGLASAVALTGYWGTLGGPLSGPADAAVRRGAGPAAQPVQDRAGRRRRAGPRLRPRGVPLGARRAAGARGPGAEERGDGAAGRAGPARARGAATVRPGTPAGLVQPGARVLEPGGRLPGRQLAQADGAGRAGGLARPVPVGRPDRRPAGAAGQLALGRARARAVRRGRLAGLPRAPPSRPSSPTRRFRACPPTWRGPASGTWWSGTTSIPRRSATSPRRSSTRRWRCPDSSGSLRSGRGSRLPPATCRRSRWRLGSRRATRPWRSSRRPTPPGGPRARSPSSRCASTVLVNGGPDSLLQLAGQGVVTSQPAVIAGDPLPVRPSHVGRHRRPAPGRQRVRADERRTSRSPTPLPRPTRRTTSSAGRAARRSQLLPVPAAGHQTVAVLSGAAQVTASSYGDWLVQAPQYDPVNAFDGNSATAWAEGSAYTPVGQWIQISFDRTLDLPSTIGIQLLVDGPNRSVATQVQVSTAAGSGQHRPGRHRGRAGAARAAGGHELAARHHHRGQQRGGRRPRRRVHRRAHTRRAGDPLPAAGRRPRGYPGGVDGLLLPPASPLARGRTRSAGKPAARPDIPGAGRPAVQRYRRRGGRARRGARPPRRQPGAGWPVHLPGVRQLNLGLTARVRPRQLVQRRRPALDRQLHGFDAAAAPDLAGPPDDQRADAQPGVRGHVPDERGNSEPAGHPAGQRGPGRRRARWSRRCAPASCT